MASRCVRRLRQLEPLLEPLPCLLSVTKHHRQRLGSDGAFHLTRPCSTAPGHGGQPVRPARESDHGGYTVRLARESDLAGICALSKLAHKEFYKRDYLPSWFPRVLKDRNRIAIVGEKDDQIVSYCMGVIGADDGKTVLGEAGRSHPDHEGQGVLRLGMEMLLDKAQKSYPNFQRLGSSTIQTEFFAKRPGTINVLSRKNQIELHIPLEKLRKVSDLARGSTLALDKLSEGDLRALLSDHAVAKRLYPDNVIGLAQNVYEATPTNVPYLYCFHGDVFVGRDLASITLSGRFPCDDGAAWRLNVNYSGAIDLDSCLAHTVQNLSLYPYGQDDKDLYLFLHVPQAFEKLYGRERLSQYLQEKFDIDQERIAIYTQYNFHYVSIGKY